MKRDDCLFHYGNYDVPHINMKQVWLQPPPHSHPRNPVQPELILRVGTEERHSAATTPEANLCVTIKHIWKLGVLAPFSLSTALKVWFIFETQ